MSVVPSIRLSCSHHDFEVREQQNPLLAGVCGHCSHVPTVPGIFSYIGVMGYILRERLQGQHSTAFRAYVEALTNALNGHCAWMKGEIRRLVKAMTPEGAGNRVGRAINRFALVAAAGELATRLGITGWQAEEAAKAVRACLDMWLADLGHLGNQEDAATLRQIRQFFTAYQYSRFADWDDSNHRPSQMVGYRKNPKAGADEGVVFLVLPEGWKEINRGRDFKKAAKLAQLAGWISKAAPNKTQALVCLPGMENKPTRVYVLGHQVLIDEMGGDENL